MPSLNYQLFLLINAPADPNAWVVQIAEILANAPLVVGPALLVSLWIWGTPSRRGALLAVAGAVFVGQGSNQLLGLLYFEPRPFMVGFGHTLIPHVPDNSFPSDHATFVWTLGVGLVTTGAARGWGATVCCYGLTVAWSRVFLGVHFPDDMAVSALVAIGGGTLAWAGRDLMTVWVLPAAETLYEAALPALRLPPRLIPRRSENRLAVHSIRR